MKTGTTAENYFGLPFIMHESKLPMQHGAQEAVSPPGSVQMHNPGRAHWQSTEKHNILVFLGLIMKISGLLNHL